MTLSSVLLNKQVAVLSIVLLLQHASMGCHLTDTKCSCSQVGTNHFGHFLLTHKLLKMMQHQVHGPYAAASTDADAEAQCRSTRPFPYQLR